MTKSKSRVIQTWYEDRLGAEHELTVRVCADGMRSLELETELPDMPSDEEDRLLERIAELFWEAERDAYLLSPQAEIDGA